MEEELIKRVIEALDISHAPIKHTPATHKPLAIDKDGEPPEVAAALREQYLPRQAGDRGLHRRRPVRGGPGRTGLRAQAAVCSDSPLPRVEREPPDRLPGTHPASKAADAPAPTPRPGPRPPAPRRPLRRANRSMRDVEPSVNLWVKTLAGVELANEEDVQ